MTYLLSALPIIVIVVAMGSGRVRSIGAALIGVLATIVVALLAGWLTPAGALISAAKGLWLAWLVIAVVFAGLFFRVVVSGTDEPQAAPSIPVAARRGTVFAACFLIGPFAEAATGFGVGQVATIAMLRRAGLAAKDITVLALFSQMLVPWGAMANGTVIGAELARLSEAELGFYSALLTVPLLLTWLVLFWRFAAAAGFRSSGRDLAEDVCWVLLSAALLILANIYLGAVIAAMAALCPVIALHFWRDERPDRKRFRAALLLALPYAVLIVGLAASRGIPSLTELLAGLGSVRPFADGPVWLIWLHPATWLAAVGILTAVAYRRSSMIVSAARQAWSDGQMAALTIAIYLVIARLMADSGMAQALADGLRLSLGAWAMLGTPVIAAVLGFLTGSCNAANGLLMSSQASLAENRVQLVWIAALQNTASAALSMLSPARVAMGCAMVGRPDLERSTYARAWPLGAAALAVMLLSALAVLAATR